MFSRGGLSKSRVLFRQGTTTVSNSRRSALPCQQLQQQQPHQLQKVRRMGGGHYMHVSETHTKWGEAFGVVCWLWVFHRARSDLPVMYGFRHPWEHAPDPFAPDHHHHDDDHGHGSGHHGREEVWDKFSAKTMKFGEDDEDDEGDDEDAADGAGDDDEDEE